MESLAVTGGYARSPAASGADSRIWVLLDATSLIERLWEPLLLFALAFLLSSFLTNVGRRIAILLFIILHFALVFPLSFNIVARRIAILLLLPSIIIDFALVFRLFFTIVVARRIAILFFNILHFALNLSSHRVLRHRRRRYTPVPR